MLLWSQGGKHMNKSYWAESQRITLSRGCLKVEQLQEERSMGYNIIMNMYEFKGRK